MNVAELVNLIGFKLDKASYNAVNDATTKIMDNMESMAKKATTLFTLPIVALYGASVKMYSQEREAIAQVEQTLSTTHNRAKQSLTELLQEAGRLQRETILEDDQVIREVTNRLLTFQNIAGQQFKDAQQVIVDISAKLDPSMRNLSEVALQVGKAIDDPVLSLSMLNRVGIRFSETQKKLIEDTWKLGKRSEAQAITIKELNKTYGGSAKVLAENATGTKQFKNALGDIMEMFGKDIFPMFKRFMTWVTDLAYKLQEILTPSLRKTILIFGGLLALIGPITLGLIGIGKAGLFVNGILSQMGLGIAKSNLGILGTLGRYGLLLGQFLLIAGALFLIFDDIYNYLIGGKSLVGEFIEPWETLGPKIYEALKPYMILMGDLWNSLKKTGVAAINYTYDVMNQRSDEASKHLDEMIYNFGDSIGNIGAIILPALWAVWSVFWNTAFDFVGTLIADIIIGFEEMMKSIEKSIGRWINKFYSWVSGILDRFYLNIYNKLMNLASGVGVPSWILKLLQSNVDTTPRFGDWRNEPTTEINKFPVPYNSLDSNSSSKTSKQINVTVNAGLNVPQGTSEGQKNYLTKTVQDLFNDHINNLSRNLVQGLPGVD